MLAPLTTDWSDFDPNEYLREYYSDLGSENLALLRHHHEAYQGVPPDSMLLDFGGGPTIYSLIAAADRVREIHVSDYVEANLAELRRWLRAEVGAFDWRPFIEKTLELETGRLCSSHDVAQREVAIRRRVTRLLRSDAARTPPIAGGPSSYDVVVSNFCAESATSDRAQWRAFMQNIASLVKPRGKLITAALAGARSYSVGSKAFPAVDIAADDLIEVLEECDFPEKSIAVRSVRADRPTRHYRGLILAVATRDAGSNGACGPC